MAMMNFFILTAAERTEAVSYNQGAGGVQIDPRAVDNASPGTGINLNDEADNYAPGDPVTLAGAFVAPKRIVDDPEYIANVPGMIAFLLTLPFASLETETIFAPPEM